MKRWTKIIVTCVGVWTFSLCNAASAQEKLTVGSDCTYYPWNYKDATGVLKGYDIDVANEIGRRLKAEVDFVCLKFDGLLPALLAGRFDMIASSLSITEDRRQKIDFSVPYRLSIGQFVASKSKKLQLFNADNTVNKAAFKNVRFGIQRASTYDRWFQNVVPEATVVRYEGAEATYMDLKAGRVDAVMTNPLTAYLEFLSKPEGAGYEAVGPQITDVKYFGTGAGIGMRKGNEALRKRVDAAIVEMKEDGTLDKFSKVYFPFAVYPKN